MRSNGSKSFFMASHIKNMPKRIITRFSYEAQAKLVYVRKSLNFEERKSPKSCI